MLQCVDQVENVIISWLDTAQSFSNNLNPISQDPRTNSHRPGPGPGPPAGHLQ